MNNDHELLEAAAKAIGERLINAHGVYGLSDADCPHGCRIWNPLTDDGDALRLAMKVRLTIEILQTTVAAFIAGDAQVFCAEVLGNGPYAATRRAIVRAAAEIGKGME